MNSEDISRLAIILSLYTEALGMQAENMQRQVTGDSMAYQYDSFAIISQEILKQQ